MTEIRLSDPDNLVLAVDGEQVGEYEGWEPLWGRLDALFQQTEYGGQQIAWAVYGLYARAEYKQVRDLWEATCENPVAMQLYCFLQDGGFDDGAI